MQRITDNTDADLGRPATTRSGMPRRLSHVPSGVAEVDDAAGTYADAYERLMAAGRHLRDLTGRPAEQAAAKADEAAYATARLAGKAVEDPRAHQRQREADIAEARAVQRGEVAVVDELGRRYRETFDDAADDLGDIARQRIDAARKKATKALAGVEAALAELADVDRFGRWVQYGPTSPAAPVSPPDVADLRAVIDEPRDIEAPDRQTYAVTGHDLPAGTDGPQRRRSTRAQGPTAAE